MIDFNGSGFFARLKKVDNNSFEKMINDFFPFISDHYTEYEVLINIYQIIFIWFFIWLCGFIFKILIKAKKWLF